MPTIFLIIATVLTLACALPYIRDILRGKTKPNLVSWITWSLLTGIATAAQISAHEYTAAIFTGAATLETTAIVLLGLRHGYVKYGQFDIICQVTAIFGIILWQLFDSPVVGVVGAVLIDFIGGLPTFTHAWQRPSEETWLTFAISGAGGAFAILALTEYNWINLPYAAYITLANVIMASEILYRRNRA